MKCTSLITTCRNCQRKFRRDEHDETCPDCGEDRHCQNEAVEGYQVCVNHGAPSPGRGFYGLGRGLTTGAGSSFQLTRLAAKYNELQTDGRLLSNRAALGVLDHRIQQLAERIDLNDAPERLVVLRKLWDDYTEKRDNKNFLEAMQVSARIDAEFEAAYHDYESWKQMFEAIDLNRKLVESEVKIMKDIRAIITAEDAYELAAKLLGAVLNVVTDPQQLRRIQYEFTRIVGEQPEPRIRAGGGQVIDGA